MILLLAEEQIPLLLINEQIGSGKCFPSLHHWLLDLSSIDWRQLEADVYAALLMG